MCSPLVSVVDIYALSNPSRSMVQQHDENDQRNRNSDKPKQNRHGVSPFVFKWLAVNCGGVRLLAPGAVAKSATLGGRERRRERADEKGQRQPDRSLHRRLARSVQIGLHLGDDVVYALLGIGLA